MFPSIPSRLAALLVGCALLGSPLLVEGQAARADEPSPGATMIKFLKTGKVPADRQPTIVRLLSQRGNNDDLTFLFELAVKPDGLAPAARLAALEGLADAALTRRVQPKGDLSGLRTLVKEDKKLDPSLRLKALELAGIWKVAALRNDLQEVALAPSSTPAVREAALAGLVKLGGKESRATFEKLTTADRPQKIRYLGVAALARIDAGAAAERAAEVLAKATEADDPGPMVAAFLESKGGSDKLSAALAKTKVPADAAKLALRYLYAVGRSDASLVKTLSDAAGVETSTKPLTAKEVNDLVEEVRTRGDAARGEKVFRRLDLSCSKCHSMAGAGGQVGPELQAVGSTSPPDYLLRSILYPDESIKEEFLTVNVTTADGKVYQGIVVTEDANRLVLKDATGEQKTIAKADIEEREKGGSLMPKGLANLMTRGELIDLVRFLSELGKAGSAYPVQTTPVLRRWRVLEGVRGDLVKDVPDESTFKSQVLEVEKSRWQPVYARHAGVLPLDDLPGNKGANVVYVQGEIEVKTAGRIGLKLDSDAGLSTWIDDRTVGAGKSIETELEPGKHRVTFRVDLSKRDPKTLMVELTKAEGSEAEAVVVGGP